MPPVTPVPHTYAAGGQRLHPGSSGGARGRRRSKGRRRDAPPTAFSLRAVGYAFVVGALLLAAGCEPAETARPGPFDVEELPSPAGEGSGEPNLAADGGSVVLSWLEETGGGSHTLFMDRLDTDGWRGRTTVHRSDAFFVNWADFPSVVPVGDDILVGHWLLRGAEGGYDYGVRTAFSRDGGATWSDPWTPHVDRSPTEHGFVSILPLAAEGVGLVWLDGRDFALHGEGSSDREHAHPEGPEMSLRFRTAPVGGEPGPEILLDDRVCDCCQTDMVSTSVGPLVVYRDRSPDEVRDIYTTRRIDGAWTEPRPVHRDGWVFPACPVNGPAAAAAGERVAVAWFTGARDTARVRVAFSDDGGATFDEPLAVDDGDPAGRVDVVLLDDGSAVVSWLERRDGAAEIRIRRLAPGSAPGPAVTVARSTDNRSSGFPRLVRTGAGTMIMAWTDVRGEASTVRVARIRIGEDAGEGTVARAGRSP